MIRLFIIRLPILCIVALALNGVTFAQESTTQPANDRVDWREMLQKYGTTFSLYFIIERDAFSNASESSKTSLVRHYIHPPEDFRTKAEFLEAIRRWIPEANVEIDSNNPQYVHIREKSIMEHGPLLLDQKISLKFEGTVRGLLVTLVKRSGGELVESEAGALSGVVHGYDFQQPTKVDVQDRTYRDVLDQAIKPVGNRIVYQTALVNRGGKPVTLITLGRPK